jgi:hypothetical protein
VKLPRLRYRLAYMGRAGRPTALHTKLKDEPAHESDARIGTWPRDELERMDREFVARLEQAIARGEEYAPSSSG